ncbi:hypothetical protein JCM3765_003197 [Sporobolomyces pararoseus]
MSSPPPPLRSPSSSSPSPSSPSVTPSSFSRLPNELVQQIIENTVPHYYHSATYYSRQSTLSSLCLVSKLFHQIAKPLLFAMIKSETFTPQGPWSGISAEGFRSLVREFICWRAIEPEGLDLLMRSLSQLRKLTVSGDKQSIIDMFTLSQLKNLEYLKFYNVTMSSSCSYSFANVTALDVFKVRWAKPSTEIVTSTSFPSLSALSFAYESEITIKEVLQGVGSQLDACFASWFGFPGDQIRQVQDKTLFDFYFDSVLSLPPVKYLRLYGPSAKWPAVLGGLLVQLRRSTPKLKPSLIYLPSSPHFDLSSQNQVFAELKSECEKAGVELVFEEQPRKWTMDCGISHDFWTRMRKATAEKTLQ